MIRLLLFFTVLLLNIACQRKTAIHTPPVAPLTLVIHGGAGSIKKGNMSPEQEMAYQMALEHALDTGYTVLLSGSRSTHAVIAAITVLENSPLFNAGKGAVFTYEGKNELDASIMDGSNLMAGAVAGVTTIKNPIAAAYAVMTASDHVMLAGRGAEQFAKQQGLETVEPSYFVDSTRYQNFLNSRKRGQIKEAALNPSI